MHPSFKQLTQVHGQLSRLQLAYFNHRVIFSFDWWFLVVAFIIGWVVFIFLVDRRRISQIILYGTVVTTVTSEFDGIGTEWDLWSYPVTVVPLFTHFLPVNLCGMPVILMLIYQYARSWRSFLAACAVVSFVFAYGLEPLLVWMGIYRPWSWHHLYSLPVYFAISVGTRLFIEWLTRKEKKATESSHK